MTTLETPSRKKSPPPISVRFNTEQLSLLEELATLADLPLSTFIKKVVLAQKVTKRRNQHGLSADDRKTLLQIYDALRKSSLVNIFNDISSALNNGLAPEHATEKSALLNACADIHRLRKLLEDTLSITKP